MVDQICTEVFKDRHGPISERIARFVMHPLPYLIEAPLSPLLGRCFVSRFVFSLAFWRHPTHARARLPPPPPLLTLLLFLFVVVDSGLETALGADGPAVEKLILALRALIGIAVYENSAELEPLFPEDFHGDLKTLLLQIIDARLADWRVGAQETQVSLPRFQGVDWRIDVKRASDNVSAMSVPAVLVTIDVEEKGGTRAVTFELTKQSLATMVDGMEKIKEQLGSLKQ
jgi:COMM domain containing 9